jgi:hypothetical protein
MFRLFKYVALLAACLSLSACASNRLDTAQIAGFKKVAVISVAAEKLTLTEVALTAFGNGKSEGDIGAWGLDRHISDLLIAQLRQRYQVVPVRYQPGDFTDDKITRDLGGGIDYWTPLGDAIRSHIAGQPGAVGIDAYVVAVRTTSPIEDTNQYAMGFGVARRYAILTHRYYLHALYELVIIDGHSFKPLRTITQDDAPPSLFGSASIAYGPAEKVDASYWADSFAQLSPAQRNKIHQGLLKLVDESLPGFLRRGGLLP